MVIRRGGLAKEDHFSCPALREEGFSQRDAFGKGEVGIVNISFVFIYSKVLNC